jgi:hypothetical protein
MEIHGSPTVPFGQKEITKLTVTFSNIAKAPKNPTRHYWYLKNNMRRRGRSGWNFAG